MGGYGSDYDSSSSRSTTSKSAASYNVDAGREYSEEKKCPPPPIGKVLITNAKLPLVVAVDVTGSMSKYPKLIFEKLCVLYNEITLLLPENIKDSFEISFAAVGDANCDKAPLQVTDFAKERELDLNINSLFPEGGGGGQECETYELLAYYYAYKCEMPESIESLKPIFVLICDESYYARAEREQVKKLIGDDPECSKESKDVFKDLREKFDVFVLRRTYTGCDDWMMRNWRDVLDEKRVVIMPDPLRVVDVIIGIVAKTVDRIEKFKERIEMRQTKEQVNEVYDILERIGIETRK